jgi:putative hydrolase of HD superfamily
MNTIEETYSVVGALKTIKRQGWIDRGLDADSIAAHSHGAMVLGWIMAEEEKVDRNKVTEMLLIHDLVMAKMEDVTPSSGQYEDKKKLEEKAFRLITEILPEKLGKRYETLFAEFQEQRTAEARVAKEADKLETLFQGEVYEESTGRNDILDEFLSTYKFAFSTETGKEIFQGIKARHEGRKKK